jgi:hypothetical protein
MSQSAVLKGSEVKVYVGGKLYAEVQSIQYAIDYAESEIYGIDSQFPQEIAPGRVSVQGSVSGLVIKNLGGLQAYDLRSKINEILYAPYVSLRIKDRHSDSDLFWLPQMKVVSEQMSIQAKGVVKISFSFKGIIPYNPIDLNG